MAVGNQTSHGIDHQVSQTAMEAIQAATSLPAQMLGVSAEIGTVEVGKQADLTLVQGNPLENLRMLRNVQWTVKGV